MPQLIHIQFFPSCRGFEAPDCRPDDGDQDVDDMRQMDPDFAIPESDLQSPSKRCSLLRVFFIQVGFNGTRVEKAISRLPSYFGKINLRITVSAWKIDI